MGQRDNTEPWVKVPQGRNLKPQTAEKFLLLSFYFQRDTEQEEWGEITASEVHLATSMRDIRGNGTQLFDRKKNQFVVYDRIRLQCGRNWATGL